MSIDDTLNRISTLIEVTTGTGIYQGTGFFCTGGGHRYLCDGLPLLVHVCGLFLLPINQAWPGVSPEPVASSAEGTYKAGLVADS